MRTLVGFCLLVHFAPALIASAGFTFCPRQAAAGESEEDLAELEASLVKLRDGLDEAVKRVRQIGTALREKQGALEKRISALEASLADLKASLPDPTAGGSAAESEAWEDAAFRGRLEVLIDARVRHLLEKTGATAPGEAGTAQGQENREKEKHRVAELTRARAVLEKQLADAIASRDKALGSLRQREDQLRRSLAEIEELKKELVEARRYLEKAKEEPGDSRALVEQVGVLSGPSEETTAEPIPRIEAMVMALDENSKTVVLSAGSDDKVKEGYRFHVYRGTSGIGEVEVFRVFRDVSGARIRTVAPGQEIKRGDRATTRR